MEVAGLSLSAQGTLALSRVAIPAGQAVTALVAGSGATVVLHQALTPGHTPEPQSKATKSTPALRPDVVLSGGRSGELVKTLIGPPNSVVRGGGARALVTNEQGQVVLDITAERVKPVIPGHGFGPKRPPSSTELDLLSRILGAGQ
jgi:hypothetical protein